MRILFICSGNIIRSPLAAGMLRKALMEAGIRDVGVGSAGTMGIEDSPADPMAVALAAERGAALTAHRSRALTLMVLDGIDLVIAMEGAHLRFLAELDPSALARARLIRLYDDSSPSERNADLEDPVGQDWHALRRCAEILDRCIAGLVRRLAGGGAL